jgi:UV DNA damage endonuclease
MHPGQYIQPGSPKPEVVERSLSELRYAGRVLDLIGSSDSVLVLHMGGSFGDKLVTTTRFLETMDLEENVLKYLALENDERIWHGGIPPIIRTHLSYAALVSRILSSSKSAGLP